MAVAQLAITVPLLILGHDHDAGAHAAHELGSFDLALAVAFAVGAIRPALSAGLAWPCGIAAAGLAGTAIADLIGGQTIGADEAQHLIAVFGATLLFWQARTIRRLPGGRRRTLPAGAGTGPVAPAAVMPGRVPPPRRTIRRLPRRRRGGRVPVRRRGPHRDGAGLPGAAQTAARRRRHGGGSVTAAPGRRGRRPGLRPPAAGGEKTAATREISLSIEGMTCAACAARIEKKLNKLDDVRASVNYATATARVFAPAVLPVTELIAAVERAGYRPATAAADESRRERDRRRFEGPGGHPAGRPRRRRTSTSPTCDAG